jgi:hypothetical protein
MAADPLDAHVQDHAVCRIGWRLLIWIAVAAAKVHVELARRNVHELAAQLVLRAAEATA